MTISPALEAKRLADCAPGSVVCVPGELHEWGMVVTPAGGAAAERRFWPFAKPVNPRTVGGLLLRATEFAISIDDAATPTRLEWTMAPVGGLCLSSDYPAAIVSMRDSEGDLWATNVATGERFKMHHTSSALVFTEWRVGLPHLGDYSWVFKFSIP